jgi:hypothetical protein
MENAEVCWGRGWGVRRKDDRLYVLRLFHENKNDIRWKTPDSEHATQELARKSRHFEHTTINYFLSFLLRSRSYFVPFYPFCHACCFKFYSFI